MNRNLKMICVPVAIAAGFLFGCSSPERITDRTNPKRPSVVQTQEGYDTFGRRWGDQPVAPPGGYQAVASSKVPSRSNLAVQSYTGTITDIDYANREVSVQDPQGQVETFVVDKQVQRFNEAKVGDKVSVDYYVGYNAQIRKPTAQEEQNPLVVLEATGRAGPEAAPAGHVTRQTRAVVTIEGVDRPTQTITVKGPRGKHFVARVADPSRLDDVHVGDTIVITFFEAAAISLKPAGTETTQ